jgi:hypothetical protein
MTDQRLDDVFLPQHIHCLKPFLAMEIMERAQELEAQGKHIIHLEMGNRILIPLKPVNSHFWKGVPTTPTALA